MIFTSRDFPSPQRMGFASGESPSPKRMVFSSRGFPLHSEWDSLQRILLVNSEWNSHQLRHPLQENGIHTKRVTLSKRMGFASRGSPSPSECDSHQRVSLYKRMGFASRGSPSPKRMGFASNVGPSCSKRPLSRDSSPRPRYSRDSLFQRASPLCLSEWYSLQEIFILPNNNV